MQSAQAPTTVETASSSAATLQRWFLRGFGITSLLSLVELVDFVLFSPTMYRAAASDPAALEGVFSFLVMASSAGCGS